MPNSDKAIAGVVIDLLQNDVAFADELKSLLKISRLLFDGSAAAICIHSGSGWNFPVADHAVIDAVPPAETSLLAGMAAEELVLVTNAAEGSIFPLSSAMADVTAFAAAQLRDCEHRLWGYVCVFSNKGFGENCNTDSLRMLQQQANALVRFHCQRAMDTGRTDFSEEIRNIFRNTIDGVVVTDQDGIIRHINRRAEYLLGWTADEARGADFEQLVIPRRFKQMHQLELEQRLKAVEDDRVADRTVEMTAMRKDGSEFDIALGISPAAIRGRLLFINYIHDITERKLAMDRLDKQKEFYENILNKLPADIVVFDPNHRYLFVNPLSIKNDELRKYIIGKDDFEYAEYRKRDPAIALLRREQFLEVKKTRTEKKWEDSLPDPSGKMITHLRRLFPVLDDHDEVSMVIGFGIDITDRKIMEEKQAALVKQLSAQNVQLTDFCNIVSHNLRGPLVNMSILVKFIEETAEEDERTMLISRLNPVIENLNTTFNELVESIQIKQDLEIQSERIVLRDNMQRVLTDLEYEINNSDAIIYVNFDEAPVVHYPQKYLLSILHNLVSNSLKYQSPDRKPVIRVETKREGDSIILSVKDNGLGIDLVKHKDNFFKIGKVFHRHPNAKGFGLFMTRTQVEAMNGRIWVESVPDGGATFFVEFVNQVYEANERIPG